MATSRFDDIIDSLKRLQQEIPDSLSLKDIKQDIGNTIRNINSPLLIMVMGEFSTGKSTFINALVGQDIAKVDAKPTTAVITKLVYGATDQITVVFRDGSRKAYDADSFAKLTAEGDKKSNKLHEKMDYVERAMPIEILKSMSIIDSPGLNSIKAVHEETTRRFMDNADTVIWLFDAHNPGRQTEIDALKRLNPRLSPLVLVNKIDTIDEDEGDSIEQIITGIERTLRNNKLEAQRIVGVSAKMAVQGQKKNNEKLVEASRMADFYTAIEEVVLPRREEYKRNSLLDGLARIVFRVGSAVSEESAKAEAHRDTDYTKCMEIQMALAATNDELENVAAGFVDELENQKSTLLGARKKLKLNAAEKAFFGVLYWLGLCVEKDEKTAQQYMEEAAVRNDATAQMNLAEMYQKLGQEDKAEYWFERLGIEVQKPTAKKKTTKKSTTKDTKKNIAKKKETEDEKKTSKPKSENKKTNKKATEPKILTVEQMYQKGTRCHNSGKFSEAMEWYRKAADAGNADAMNTIGYMYEYGIGNVVNIDEKEALKWYRKAADAGNILAKEKADSLQQAATLTKPTSSIYAVPDVHARNNLTAAEMYRMGNHYYNSGHCNEALELFKQAAIKGNSAAMYRLGNIYEKSNKEESITWYKKAADVGHKLAKEKIGETKFQSTDKTKSQSTGKNSISIVPRNQNVHNNQNHNKILAMPNSSTPKPTINTTESTFIPYVPTYSSHTGKSSPMISHLASPVVPKPTLTAEEMYRKGNQCYNRGSYNEAVSWYKKAAEAGHTIAPFNVGYAYDYGEGVTENKGTALIWYRKAASAGNASAMNSIGYMFEQGRGVPKNTITALSWYQKAAYAGNASAMNNIGVMYQDGNGVQKDIGQAIMWYWKAIEAGNTMAMWNIAVLYENQGNKTEALNWYRKSAEAGNDKAKKKVECLLHPNAPMASEKPSITAAEMYRKGNQYFDNGNYTEALNWYLKAADKGYAVAMNDIGYLCENGLGVIQDYNKAFQWYHQAASYGNAKAKYHMAILYEYGYGVGQNTREAMKWYREAAKDGITDAKKKVRQLGG